MKITLNDLQDNCVKHTLRVADNIEQILKEKDTTLYKAVNGENIDIDIKDRKQFINLIYPFLQKIEKYRQNPDFSKLPRIAYSTIVTFAEYLDIPISDVINDRESNILSIPFYNSSTDDDTKIITVSDILFTGEVNRKKLFAAKVIDSGMQPSININDVVFAEKKEKYHIDGIYIIKTERGYFPKRIIFHKNTADVISNYDTTAYVIKSVDELYDEELDESVYIEGKVISTVNNSIG